MDYFNKVSAPKSCILDPCTGTFVYAFVLASQGRFVTAGDLIRFNTEKMRQKQLEMPLLEDIYTGDISDMSRFSNNSFDAVLCMGALYHLPKESQRRKAVEEYSLSKLFHIGIDGIDRKFCTSGEIPK